MQNWLSLFDGMSCLQIAAKELGISPDKYYASEIDQHAIKQTQLNFPDTIQLGSVTEWKTCYYLVLTSCGLHTSKIALFRQLSGRRVLGGRYLVFLLELIFYQSY